MIEQVLELTETLPDAPGPWTFPLVSTYPPIAHSGIGSLSRGSLFDPTKTNMKTQTHLLILACLLSFTVNAQLTVDPSQTPLQLVQNVLLGNGILASNITFSGNAPNIVDPQFPSFNSSNSNVGITQGVILSTGIATRAVGPNNADIAGANLQGNDPAVGGINNDPDLMILTGGTAIRDAAILDFSFVPTGNTISFRFVFASEEYPGFVCGAFNDAFGFFLSGPGITGPFSNNARNLAVLPGTNVPVTINSVNNGQIGTDPASQAAIANCANIDPNWQANSVYYVGNGNDNNPDNTVMRYNGSTVVLTASAQVQCGQQYRIKIAIGDAGDSIYDSAIFLQGGTFASPAPVVNINAASPNTACLGSNNLMPFIQTPGVAPYTYAWETGGNIISAANMLTVVADSAHTYTLHLTDACGATATDSILITPQPMVVAMPQDITLPCNFSGTVVPTLSGMGPGTYSYQWTVNDSLVGTQQGVVPIVTTTPQYHVFSATDQCGLTVVDSFLVSMVQYAPLALVTSADTTVFCGGDATTIAVEQVTGGLPPYAYSWSDAQGNALSTDSLFTVLVTSDMSYTVTATDVCGSIGQATINTLVPVHAPMVVSISGAGTICADASTELSALVTGGSGVHTFLWADLQTNNGNITVSPNDATQYTVEVTDQCGYEASASMLVQIERPVTDIYAINVGADEWSFTASSSPLVATYDWDFGDGAWSTSNAPTHSYMDLENHIVELTITTSIGCIATDTVHFKPMAHVYFPNAFTPNGDGINDSFGPVGHDMSLLEFVIFDRWGSIVFEASGTSAQWDGRLADGQQAPTGVYVCQYRVAGEQMPTTAGMSHVTLLADDGGF